METVEDQVLSTIKSGKAKMRPKWHFSCYAMLNVMAIAIVLMILIYLASFVVFALHQTGAWFATDFGFEGWYILFSSLPWVLVALSAAFIATLAVLARGCSLGYQWPVAYALLAILFLIVGGALLITHTALSLALFNPGPRQMIPLLGDVYQGFGVLTSNDIHRGTIAELTASGFVIQSSTMEGHSSTIVVGPQTRFPYGSVFTLGDSVVVIGNRENDGMIQAMGVEKVLP